MLTHTALDALLVAVPYVLFTFGIGCLLAAIGEAFAETFAPEQTHRAKAVIRSLAHRHLHIGDPRTKAQRDLDNQFMAIVATYHREQ